MRLENESIGTRKMLALVPVEKGDWKPHAKNMAMKHLATHVAETAGWIESVLTTEGIDFATMPYEPRSFETNGELLTFFDENVAKSYGFNGNSFIAMYVPNTYEFYWNTSAEGFVKRMAKEYKSFWNLSRKAKAKKWNLTESEITTLASIVQEETNMATDKPIVPCRGSCVIAVSKARSMPGS